MKKMMIILSLSLLSLWGCASGGKVMTAQTFSDVSVGMTDKEVKDKFGRPFAVKHLENGEVEYRYIEKVHYGPRVIEERHYLIILKNGKVISTKAEDFTRPIYERNSYEMQTSYNEED